MRAACFPCARLSNVGKTTTGELLAEKLGYVFYDLDEEVKKYFNVTLEEFVNTGTLEERDQKRAEVLEKIAGDRHNKVVAVTPIAYMDYIRKFLKRKNVLAIELRDYSFRPIRNKYLLPE